MDLSPVPLDAVKAKWQNTVRLLALAWVCAMQNQLEGLTVMMQDNTPVVKHPSAVQAFQENFKAAVLAAERSLLFTLGFNFSLTLPQKCLLHPEQGIATFLNLPIEQACASAAPNRDLQKANVQQAAWDICNERYPASSCHLGQHNH